MRLGIDASNVRVGGGITHLVELLRAADPTSHGFSEVIVWGGKATLQRIDERPWLARTHDPLLDRSLPYRIYWQRFRLSRAARSAGCGVLFVPGGSYFGDFRPIVTMSRNLLPFEWKEQRRYGCSWIGLRLLLLRWTQARTFREADGLIFLSEYARTTVMREVKRVRGRTKVVPHGVSNRFAREPRPQRAIGEYSPDRPFRILYVSMIDLYKHQWHVVEAVARLRERGLPVALDLVGPAYAPALKRVNEALSRFDPRGEFVRYLGAVPHEQLHARYSDASLCLFASSCENMPNILLEGMASGLPIVSSNRGPMPEVLSDAGVYCDPENPGDVARALRELIESPDLRARLALASSARSRAYSWPRCASETLEFLRCAAKENPAATIAARPA